MYAVCYTIKRAVPDLSVEACFSLVITDAKQGYRNEAWKKHVIDAFTAVCYTPIFLRV